MRNNSIIHLVRELDRKIRDKDDETFTEINFKPRFLKLYLIIKDNKGIPQNQLAKAAKFKPSSINATIVQMESEGYIYRLQDEEDLRITRVYLTEKSLAKDESIFDLVQKNEKYFLDKITEEEQEEFKKIIKKMI